MLPITPADDIAIPMELEQNLPMVSDHQETSLLELQEEEDDNEVVCKQVRFNETALYIEPTRDSISREDKKKEWYCQKDFITFFKESSKLILRAKQLISGNQLNVIKMEDICLRGLEANFSARALMNRNARHNCALHCVLNEQDRQQYNDEADEDLIRELYMVQSRQSVKLAIDLARQDAEAVREIVAADRQAALLERNKIFDSPKKRRVNTIGSIDHFPLSPTRRPAPIASPRARSRRLQPHLRMDRESFGMTQHEPVQQQPVPAYQVTNQFAPGVTVNMHTRTIVLDTNVSSFQQHR